MARRIPGYRSAGIGVAGSVGQSCPAALPAAARAQAGRDRVAEFSRTAVLGAVLHLLAGRVRAGTPPVFELAVPESRVSCIAGRLEILLVGASGWLGSGVFHLGLGGGPVCFRKESARGPVGAAGDSRSATQHGDLAHLTGAYRSDVLSVDVRGQRIRRGSPARRG